MTRRKQALVAGLVLAAGVLVFVVLRLLRTAPPQEPPAQPGALVETVIVQAREAAVGIDGEGILEPLKQVELVAEVSGRIIWISDQLRPGGLFKAGDLMARLEPRDYRLVLRQARTELTQARADLEIELGRRKVARREWEIFAPELEEVDPASRRRALRVPHFQSAKARVEAAEARVARAKLDLDRTELTAPFDCFVQSESAEVGRRAGPALGPIATLVGSRAFWAKVAIPTDVLPRIDVPGVNATDGSPARVRQRTVAGWASRDGVVVGLLGNLEEQSRLARVLVRVDDPLGLEQRDSESEAQIPLLANSFVHVSIRSNRMENLVEVPGEAIHDGKFVYVDDRGVLDIRQVEIADRVDGMALVRSGLRAGARVVVSPIPRPVEGMKLRRTPSRTRSAEGPS